MKANSMRTPDISDLFDQKATYKTHLKKLEHIRQQRKIQLQSNNLRNQQIQNIKDRKSRSFAHNFNTKNLEINRSNLKFLCKLQKIKPSTHYGASLSETDKSTKDIHIFNPSTKKKVIQTEKQNTRIFFKMKSVSSSLNQSAMINDYAKTQRIKSRISKYSQQNNKIFLKSQKFFTHNRNATSYDPTDKNANKNQKKSLVSYYRKEDIIKNTIDKPRVRSTTYKKILPTIKKSQLKLAQFDDQAIFTTEPVNRKRVSYMQRRLA